MPSLLAASLVVVLAGLLGACAPAAYVPMSPAEPLPAREAAMMAPGVSLELARERAATLSDVRYALSLDLLSDPDRAYGEVAIAFDRAPGAGSLIVDFRGPELSYVAANGVVIEEPFWENGHVLIPAALLRSGANRLAFRFAADVAAAGASIIRVDDRTDDTRYLYTLLVPADANLLFPSFDQPDLKGRFTIDLLVPDGWEVLSNGPLAERVAERGGARWHFRETEPISTYLVAFAAGPWATWTSTPEGEHPITLYARQSRRDEVDADEQIHLNRDALVWLERYFDMDFPFAKVDLLLAPAFPFGGMEHVGAIFYNESRFVFREPPTLNERLGRAATIYHEMAHQWFGDLVTMTWFDDLWLKEGFSTYIAARMQEDLQPGTGAWKSFYLRNKPLAYAVDATSGTTPVWQELSNLDLAKGNYGPIVYNKAPAILKQLEFLVGEEAFRAGLQLFARRYAYANATWQDLLATIEEASGVPLAHFGEQYILRAGMPVIDTVVETSGGYVERLALVQRPARDLPRDPGGWWPGRVLVRLGYRDRDDVVIPVTFTGETTEVVATRGLPAPDYVFANDEDHGYGLFLLDEASARFLLGHVGQIEDELLRAMVWGSLWDLVQQARLAPPAYVEAVLRELPGEADEQIASSLLNRTRFALERYAGEADRAELLPRFETLLLARADDPTLEYGFRKASLDALIAVARSPAMHQVLKQYLADERHFDGEPLREPSRWGIIVTLLASGDPDAERLYVAEQARDTSAEADRWAFIAGTALPDAYHKATYFRRYLDDPELNEEWVTASLGAFHYPEHAALTLPHLRPALERLEWIRDNRRIFFLPQWINAFVGGQHSAEALAIVDAFLADRPDLPPDVRRKVLEARDHLERTVRIRG
jgi:aminopeptidase N